MVLYSGRTQPIRNMKLLKKLLGYALALTLAFAAMCTGMSALPFWHTPSESLASYEKWLEKDIGKENITADMRLEGLAVAKKCEGEKFLNYYHNVAIGHWYLTNSGPARGVKPEITKKERAKLDRFMASNNS